MAFTYSGDPDTSEMDSVRFLISDTQSSRPLFQDAEVKWAITQETNVFMAGALLCDLLVARAGSVKSKKISEFSITYDPMFYRGLAVSLRARGMTYQTPYAGGISWSDKEVLRSDPDWVAPAFSKNQANDPGAPSPTAGPNNPLTTL